ncbi:MAG: VirB4 family type IV secretion system protein, partial [Microgenomates group bacterium]
MKKKEKEKEEEKETQPNLQDIISPSAILLTPHYLKIDEKYFRGYFIFAYPRYLYPAWLAQMIFLPVNFDLSLHIHPVSTALYLKKLLRKLTEVQAEILERQEKLKVRDPELETAQRDIERLRDQLTVGQEKIFHVGVYLGLYGSLEEELKNLENVVRSIFETKLIYLKKATFQQKEIFQSCLPVGLDKVYLNEVLHTEALSTIFPFVSLDITSHEGILYGINTQNNSLILFDRFSLENANMVVFGTSGSGKSYFTKMEILRYLMMGVDFLIIDPENEYERLAQSVDGSFLNISLSSPHHLNPFDLPVPKEDETAQEVLRTNIINLV